jgi:hypothetical protein
MEAEIDGLSSVQHRVSASRLDEDSIEPRGQKLLPRSPVGTRYWMRS